MSDADPRDAGGDPGDEDEPTAGEGTAGEGAADGRDAARDAIDAIEQPDEPDGDAMTGQAPTG